MRQATQAQALPTTVDNGLEFEQCTAEEAKSAFDGVASYVACQAAAFVAKAAQQRRGSL